MEVSRFWREIVRNGTGLETPNKGSTCQVKLKIVLEDGTIAQESQEEMVLGDGDSELSETLEKCLECMHAEEICIVHNVPCDSGILVDSQQRSHCELELISFTKAKEPWEITSSEKMNLAVHHKAKGTISFKAGKWLPAARHYSQAVKLLILAKDQVPEDRKEDYDQLRFSCLLNLSACQGKLGWYEHVTKSCTKALVMVPDSVKALFRRGQAFVVLNEFEKAREDLEKALALDPHNRVVREQLGILKQKESNHDLELSKALGVMFGR